MDTTPGPDADTAIPAFLRALGIPALADIHVHFLPPPVLTKVRAYFDNARTHYGVDWPVHYRQDEEEMLEILRGFGLAAIPALCYPHKPGMARWLNDWTAAFAARVPDAIGCATLYPEPDVAEYVDAALRDGARLFKTHVQVGGFAPDDPDLDAAWDLLEQAQVPVVMHAGSGPVSGEFTGPPPVLRLLEKHPELVLVIAHLGMPEYHAFADIAESHRNVHLDTTMAATDFTDRFAPLPTGYVDRMAQLRDKIILGSDFPNIPYPYADQLQALARLELGDDWLRDVLWHNGSRLLGLKG